METIGEANATTFLCCISCFVKCEDEILSKDDRAKEPIKI